MGALERVGQVSGEVRVTLGTRGDAYVLLYPAAGSRARNETVPEYVTAVSDERLSRGDFRFVFGAVQPNPYRMYAVLDFDRDFPPDLAILAQPGAGDRRSAFVDLNLQPGEALVRDLVIDIPVSWEPPAFRLESDAGLVSFSDVPSQVESLTLVLDDLGGLLDRAKLAFLVRLVDQNQDGLPDDDDGDGIPDLYPKVFLRYLPKPGQTVPVDRMGRPATVLLPMALDPAPFLATLGANLERAVAVERLTAFLVPQAVTVTDEPGRGPTTTALEAIPPGEYELVVVHESGQFWSLPNELATARAERFGGPFPAQGTRFQVVRGP